MQPQVNHEKLREHIGPLREKVLRAAQEYPDDQLTDRSFDERRVVNGLMEHWPEVSFDLDTYESPVDVTDIGNVVRFTIRCPLKGDAKAVESGMADTELSKCFTLVSGRIAFTLDIERDEGENFEAKLFHRRQEVEHALAAIRAVIATQRAAARQEVTDLLERRRDTLAFANSLLQKKKKLKAIYKPAEAPAETPPSKWHGAKS